MLKTVKGKVIVGTVAVGLLSSAGVALGASGARQNLKNWFDKQAGQAFWCKTTSQRKRKNWKTKESSKSGI